MFDTIDCLKKLLEKKIPFSEKGIHSSAAKITINTAYRLINERKLKPMYGTAGEARKALNKNLTGPELTETIRREYAEESRYEDTPRIAVKWANITSEVEKTYGIEIDKKEVNLYRQKPVICGCGGECQFTVTNPRYRSGRPVWICPECGASVGVHKGTDMPLGKPVPSGVGKKRIKVHEEITRIENSGMSMDHIYKMLSRKMGLKSDQTHIGMFNDKQCDEALKILSSIQGQFNLV